MNTSNVSKKSVQNFTDVRRAYNWGSNTELKDTRTVYSPETSPTKLENLSKYLMIKLLAVISTTLIFQIF